MKLGHNPLVMGNWKMNPLSPNAAKRLALDLKKGLSRIEGVEVVVVPPAVFLPIVEGVRNSKGAFFIGSQNVHHEKLGGFTGEISIPMLEAFGVTHVIIGHSERRRDGETNEMIQKKMASVIKAGLTAVLCVGETARDHGGHYFNDIETQIRQGLAGLSKAKLGHVVIAYEPVWAIGTGHTATPSDVHEMRLFIEKTLADLYGRTYAQKLRVLYGGSVNPQNAELLMAEGTVSGFLVGGASLHADEFIQIVKLTKKVCEA
jgi:triosephosphate isomerase (TIM)